MLLNFLKLLAFFWPFFKSVIFKDRPVKEVLQANRQFTYLFIILIGLAIMLHVTTATLAESRDNLVVTHRELRQLEAQLADTRQRMQQLKSTVNAREVDCQSRRRGYDKDHLLQLLGD